MIPDSWLDGDTRRGDETTQMEQTPTINLCVSPGLIKTALPGMDREVKENYQVVIQAKDMAGQMGGLSGTTTVSIALSDVNDNPPRFTQSE